MVQVDESIFRAYDIRGIVDNNLTEEVVTLIGKAVGSEALKQDQCAVIVARDGRLSGERLIKALSEGIAATGCNVIDIGAVPTPLLYFAAKTFETHSGVMITGSHNPPEYNGLKVVINGETLAEKGIHQLYERIVENHFVEGQGTIRNAEIIQTYIDRVCSDIKIQRPLHIAIDSGNGICGPVAVKLFKALGCQVEELYCKVDGNFPNHHPDPSVPTNLEDLVSLVQKKKLDIGLAFDGDGDRLGVVTNQGNIIFPDRLLMLLAMDVLSRNPGAEIIYDVKCTHFLHDLIKQHGGIPIMWKTGHSFIKQKLQHSSHAVLAGEMSGHIFFKERWYGFDDAIYTGARLLEILAKQDKTIDELFGVLPNSVNTPELKLPISEAEKFKFMAQFKEEAKFDGAKLITIDGLRVEYPDGWGLMRPSNTTPVLVLRFEAENEGALKRIQALFRQELLRLNPELQLPF